MKIKKAIETLFSDAGTSLGAKTEIISFLRRYSMPSRPCTHYACRGRVTETLVNLLDALGFEKDTDYKIMTSSFDEEFSQIRWVNSGSTSNTNGKIGELTSDLVSVTRRLPSFFDELYVKVTTKSDCSSLIAELPDTDSMTPGARVTPLNPHYFAVKIRDTTAKIVSSMFEIADKMKSEKYAAQDVANFNYSFTEAINYLDARFNRDGSAKSEDAPYVLPLCVLEPFAWAKGLVTEGPRNSTGINALVFAYHQGCTDLFRLYRSNERLMWSACLNAPLDFLWNCSPDLAAGADGDVSASRLASNPLRGYFFRSGSAIDNAELDNKAGVFVGGNAALIGDTSAEDLITPALCVNYRRELVEYMMGLYRVTYECGVGVTCQSRVGIPYEMDVWSTNKPEGGGECEVLEHSRYWKQHNGITKVPVILQYGLFLANEVSCSYTDVRNIASSSYPINITFGDGMSEGDFSNQYLTKDELAWELFFMTHKDIAAGNLTSMVTNVPSYIRNRQVDDMTALRNMKYLKDRIRGYTGTDLADLSRCGSNVAFASDDNAYTPLSAFVDGICVEIRKAWSPDATTQPALKKRADGSRPSTFLLTNIYSGMFTDLSPLVGSEQDTGDVFPNPLSAEGRDVAGVESARSDTEQERLDMTKFLDRLNGGSMEQVKFSRRTAGTARSGAVIVETNVDATAFLDKVNASKFDVSVGTLLIQTLILGNTDPFCAFNSGNISSSRNISHYHQHSRMVDCSCRHWRDSFVTSEDFTLPCGAYGVSEFMNKNVTVSARQDADGRLVLIFIVRGDVLTYARHVFRHRCGFPMETAYVKSKLANNGSGEYISVKSGERNSDEKRLAVIRKAILNGAYDYHGYSDYSETGFNIGPLFRQPIGEKSAYSYDYGYGNFNRTWFSSYTESAGGRISCIHVNQI